MKNNETTNGKNQDATRQKSFDDIKSTLYLVPTPIGNLSEMSERALQTLKDVDLIACEDTRNSGKLLKYFNISKPLISHHEHNQETSIPKIIQALQDGKNIAVISDAGYPLVSDPGQNLVRTCTSKNIPVVPISGPNAALDALVASGLDTHHYLFYGFLDAKSAKRIKQLETLKHIPYTIIFYEAPHRIEAMLQDVLEVFGNRQMCLGREITKIHEEMIRGSVEGVKKICGSLKGEMVIVIEGASSEKEEIPLEDAAKVVDRYVEEGLSTKKAIQQVAKDLGLSKNELYQFVQKRKNSDN